MSFREGMIGMLDAYGRKIEYIRVSLTDRCNLRCRYCMPAEGVEWHEPESVLSYEEILKVLEAASRLGLKKVRITGGEPLVRKGVVDFVRRVKAIPGIEDIALSTNGIKLAMMAKDLKEAGINRVNISLDTLKSDRYKYVTRYGSLDDVFRGIDRALELGLEPVKINAVIMKGFNDDEWAEWLDLVREKPIHVRFIELMPLGESHPWAKDAYLPFSEMIEGIKEYVELISGGRPEGAGPAAYYTFLGAKGSIGFIHALSNHFCGDCNRIRLTATGEIHPCLASLDAVDIKGALRNGEDIEAVLAKAILLKPEEHHMELYTGEEKDKRMFKMGG